MKRSNPIAIASIAVSLLVPSAAFASAGLHSPVNAMFSKTKTVQLTLRNDSSSPMELKVGEEIVKLDPGKSVNVKLPLGARVIANTKTEYHEPGALIAEVSNSLSGAIIHIK